MEDVAGGSRDADVSGSGVARDAITSSNTNIRKNGKKTKSKTKSKPRSNLVTPARLSTARAELLAEKQAQLEGIYDTHDTLVCFVLPS